MRGSWLLTVLLPTTVAMLLLSPAPAASGQSAPQNSINASANRAVDRSVLRYDLAIPVNTSLYFPSKLSYRIVSPNLSERKIQEREEIQLSPLMEKPEKPVHIGINLPKLSRAATATPVAPPTHADPAYTPHTLSDSLSVEITPLAPTPVIKSERVIRQFGPQPLHDQFERHDQEPGRRKTQSCCQEP